MSRFPAIVLALLGCSTPPEPLPTLSAVDTLYVSTAFSVSELAAIEAGANLWRDATHGVVSLSLVLTDQRPNTHSFYISPIDLPGEQRGEAGTFTLRLDPYGYDSGALSMTVAHELGHYLGLPHLPIGLMQEHRPESDRCLDAYTLDAYCSVASCPTGFSATCLSVQ